MPRIEIRKNPRRKQPYSVHYLSRKKIGKGKLEILAATENLPNKKDCIANIKSMASIFHGMSKGVANPVTFVTVVDLTGKEPKEIEVLY